MRSFFVASVWINGKSGRVGVVRTSSNRKHPALKTGRRIAKDLIQHGFKCRVTVKKEREVKS